MVLCPFPLQTRDKKGVGGILTSGNYKGKRPLKKSLGFAVDSMQQVLHKTAVSYSTQDTTAKEKEIFMERYLWVSP